MTRRFPCPPPSAPLRAYVNPIVAVFLGWLLLDKTVTARTLAASAVILGAVIVITLHGNRVRRV